jgi:hypothetical protein
MKTIMSYLKLIASVLKPADPIEEYLSQSTDLCDLERREKEIFVYRTKLLYCYY